MTANHLIYAAKLSEQTGPPLFFMVDPFGVAERKILHDGRQRDVAGLENEMDMVGHQAKSVDAAAELFYDVLKQKVETVPVTVVEENRLPGVATEDNMVNCARKMDAGFTNHDQMIRENGRKSSLTPGGPRRSQAVPGGPAVSDVRRWSAEGELKQFDKQAGFGEIIAWQKKYGHAGRQRNRKPRFVSRQARVPSLCGCFVEECSKGPSIFLTDPLFMGFGVAGKHPPYLSEIGGEKVVHGKIENRRPIGARSAGWAQKMACFLADSAITPNQISVASVFFAAIGSGALVFSSGPIGFVGCALAIQARLLCNLLDGMVAVEGGKKSALGQIYNEFPDRIADSLLIVTLGYCINIPAMGWFGALVAALTAYVRIFGGSLGLAQDFRGPMAKQHRMAVVTLACLAGAVEQPACGTLYSLIAASAVVAGGAVITCVTRTRAITRQLRIGA